MIILCYLHLVHPRGRSFCKPVLILGFGLVALDMQPLWVRDGTGCAEVSLTHHLYQLNNLTAAQLACLHFVVGLSITLKSCRERPVLSSLLSLAPDV